MFALKDTLALMAQAPLALFAPEGSSKALQVHHLAWVVMPTLTALLARTVAMNVSAILDTRARSVALLH
jgi:hypothetical protein